MTSAIDLNIDPKSLGRVAVLFGGTSAERPVSLMSGNGVLAALQSIGVDAQAFDPAERPLQALKDEGFTRAFIALHGRGGEDGTIQGALEWLGMPYTGSGVTASGVAMDKTMTKRLWAAEGLATPQYLALSRAELTRERIRQIPDELGLPVIVKPPHEGSASMAPKSLAPCWARVTPPWRCRSSRSAPRAATTATRTSTCPTTPSTCSARCPPRSKPTFSRWC